MSAKEFFVALAVIVGIVVAIGGMLVSCFYRLPVLHDTPVEMALDLFLITFFVGLVVGIPGELIRQVFVRSLRLKKVVLGLMVTILAIEYGMYFAVSWHLGPMKAAFLASVEDNGGRDMVVEYVDGRPVVERDFGGNPYAIVMNRNEVLLSKGFLPLASWRWTTSGTVMLTAPIWLGPFDLRQW
mgnify:CR=1 FL=1